MKVLYYDCFSGICGDMNLGAMLDLGVDRDFLLTGIGKLDIDGYDIRISKGQKKGIRGTRVEVHLDGHDTHSHHHDDSHKMEQRNLKAIAGLINESDLDGRVKELSLSIFEKIARAEAKVHGTSIDEIHFHEVGAIDSIIDIVGAALCFDYLGVDRILASPVELGGGTVKCAHGILPVPAPATAELLKGKPVRLGAVPFEATTPTGAAILVSTVSEFTSRLDFQISAIGYGIGGRDTVIPNVLRVYLGDTDEAVSADHREEAIILECNIDDMNPELYGPVMDSLLSHGADDVFLTSVIMKKSRPAVKITVLCSPERCRPLKEIILTGTPTLGVREYSVKKTTLERDFTEIITEYGPVRLKNAYYMGKKIKSKPEFEDCRRLAAEMGVSIQEVYASISRIQSSDKGRDERSSKIPESY